MVAIKMYLEIASNIYRRPLIRDDLNFLPCVLTAGQREQRSEIERQIALRFSHLSQSHSATLKVMTM